MGPLLYVSARVHIGDSNCLSCKSSSHPKHGSGKMNSYVDVGVQIVMGLNPYLEEENRFVAILHYKYRIYYGYMY